MGIFTFLLGERQDTELQISQCTLTYNRVKDEVIRKVHSRKQE